MSRKANLIRKIREYISQEKTYDAHINFFCDINKDRQALKLIINEMDMNGISFRDAVINLILADRSEKNAVQSKKKGRRQPKINSARVDLVSDTIEIHADNDQEVVQSIKPEQDKENSTLSDSPDTKEKIETPVASEQTNNNSKLSPEDKEALRKSILSSYKI